MCDWEAEEYAEYLLWVEMEKTRARLRAQPAREERSISSSTPVVLLTESVEA